MIVYYTIVVCFEFIHYKLYFKYYFALGKKVLKLTFAPCKMRIVYGQKLHHLFFMTTSLLISQGRLECWREKLGKSRMCGFGVTGPPVILSIAKVLLFL